MAPGRRRGYGQPRFFKGALDEVMIFNRVLTPEEVRALYQTGTLQGPARRKAG